jgi:type IV pilus assembly protein PilW
MEMKHKQKRNSLGLSNQGFTMIELLVAMVVSLLAMAAIYSTFLAQHRSYQVQRETSEMQQNIRTAMYYMQREIRMAGSNPYNTLPLPSFGIIAAGPTSITFTEDIRGDNPGDPPDGAVDDPEENITYTLNGTNLERTDNVAAPLNPQVVAQNIDWLDFVYLDSAGGVTAVLGDIRSVQITIVARTNDPLLYGTTNTRNYTNLQGTVIYTALGDNVSRRRLATLIHCRNLGI